jgi:hypothetical protein
LYQVVLREALNDSDVAQFVEAETLRRLWPHLVIPERVRAAWERAVPELLPSELFPLPEEPALESHSQDGLGGLGFLG